MDKEVVIKALKCCTTPVYHSVQNRLCDQCPYMNGREYGDCCTDLMEDALELLQKGGDNECRSG